MKKRSTELPPEDKEVWDAFSSPIKPLKKKKRVVKETKAPALPRDRIMQVPMPEFPVRMPKSQLKANDHSTMDGKKHERFRKGELPIEATLDLHGRNFSQAFQALERFILESAGLGRRVVLIITGKGLHPSETPQTLREALPIWLNTATMRPFIVAFHKAAPKHGGSGAFYLLLKRTREK